MIITLKSLNCPGYDVGSNDRNFIPSVAEIRSACDAILKNENLTENRSFDQVYGNVLPTEDWKKYHIYRIATLITTDKWQTPIVVLADLKTIENGQHRVIAAKYLNELEIDATLSEKKS